MPAAYPTFVEGFTDLPDPRVERTRAHHLIDRLVIAVCAVIWGAEGWDDCLALARAKPTWLKQRRELPNGIPAADTFRRGFSRLEPSALQTGLLRGTPSWHKRTQGDLLAFDGTT